MTSSFYEAPMKPGAWSVDLLPDTPKEVTDVLRIPRGADNLSWFGTVWVTPTHLDLNLVGRAGVVAEACYAGRYVKQRNRVQLSGDGISAWLGDVDGNGSLRVISMAGDSFTTAITNYGRFLGGSTVTAGTITDPGGTITLTVNDSIHNRDCLAYICRHFSTEWRLNPDLTFDAGTETALYGATPVALWHPNARQPEPGLTILKGTADHTASVERYIHSVIVWEDVANFATRLRSADPVMGSPWDAADVANYLDITRRIPMASGVPLGSLNAQGDGYLLFEPLYEETITLTVDDYDPALKLCGKSLYLYDPAIDLDDATASQIIVAGEHIRPLTQRVVELDWEFPRNGGFYFQNSDGTLDPADRPIYDLTRWVDKRGLTGQATVTCGAPKPHWEIVARKKYEDWSA